MGNSSRRVKRLGQKGELQKMTKVASDLYRRNQALTTKLKKLEEVEDVAKRLEEVEQREQDLNKLAEMLVKKAERVEREAQFAMLCGLRTRLKAGSEEPGYVINELIRELQPKTEENEDEDK